MFKSMAVTELNFSVSVYTCKHSLTTSRNHMLVGGQKEMKTV